MGLRLGTCTRRGRLAWIWLWGFCLPLLWAQPVAQFRHLTPDDGLSRGSVLCIFQDSRGFLWFGTMDGLNRFDGYEFKVFRFDPEREQGLSGNYITCMTEDDDGYLWIGTENGGLNRYDPVHERFTTYRNDPVRADSLGGDTVRSLAIDRSGEVPVLWVGTLESGLNRMEMGTGRFSQFGADIPETLQGRRVNSILEVPDHGLWVGTDRGLEQVERQSDASYRFRRHAVGLDQFEVTALHFDGEHHLLVGDIQGQVHRFDLDTQSFELMFDSASPVRAIVDDTRGRIWVATRGSGLFKLNPFTKETVQLKHEAGDAGSLTNNVVWSAFCDRTGILWFGTLGSIDYFDAAANRFPLYQHEPGNPNSLSSNSISTIGGDLEQPGVIWVGTFDAGFNRYDLLTGAVRRFSAEPGKSDGLSHNGVLALHDGGDGRLWVGCYGGGINVLDKATSIFSHYRHDGEDADSLGSDQVTRILGAEPGFLWVGTDGAGLNRLETATGKFTAYRHASKQIESIASNRILSMHVDEAAALWIGTFSKGLDLMRPDGGFTHYAYEPGDPTSISYNMISTIAEGFGYLWIGTGGGGLNRLDRKTGTFRVWRVADGLPGNTIHGILADDRGFLWLSTNNGLARFDSRTEAIRSYGLYDGVQGREFNQWSYYRSPGGKLFFGGTKGLISFEPSRITESLHPVPVQFIDFRIFNQSVTVGDARLVHPLEAAIGYTEQITLGHEETMFSVAFAGLNYAVPEANRYRYLLEGFDSDWVETHADLRVATYTNLEAGSYTLRVKAANKDGIWSPEETRLRIEILPPPWKTPLAYLLYLAVICVSLWFCFRYLDQRKQFAYEQEVVRHLRKVDKMKDQFLANTSHELRTPLNGIIGLVESLLEGVAGNLPEKARDNLGLIRAGGKRLTRLVEDILDFSKLEEDKVELAITAVDPHTLADVVLTLSGASAREKALDLVNEIPNDFPMVAADPHRLEQVLFNLVGNAIKFTERGTVRVGAHVAGKMAVIEVADSGIGIPKEMVDQVFEPFTQAENHTARINGGTGLGLAITRMLVNLHGGSINLNSEAGNGTTMTFTLPLAENQDKPSTVSSVTLTADALHGTVVETAVEAAIVPVDDRGRGFRILIVDDEPINRKVLNELLRIHGYEVEEAVSGFQALNLLEDHVFDLVLLDIMMPRLSGYETCRKIRARYSEEELPVIFLSAKNQVESLVTGFEVGGNDYLTKPISKDELFSRLQLHLRILDVNRNLEKMVRKRTVELVARTAELEAKNEEILHSREKIVAQEKMASLGLVSAGLAHEINNPTNFVHNGVVVLKQELADFRTFLYDVAGDDTEAEIMEELNARMEPMFRQVDSLFEGTVRIIEIITDVRVASRGEGAEQMRSDLNRGLRTTMRLVRPNFKHLVHFESDLNGSLPVICRPNQLNQVFMNLMVNACQAVEQKLEKAGNREVGRIRITTRTENGEAIIAIEDEGEGIAPELLEEIFKPFFTTKSEDKGTGLGLAISREIVARYGGTLKASSTVGVGSIFTVQLPLAD